MQELRFVAVSEDGSYAVLAVPGRSGRYILPIDERLRAVAQGQTSRLAQYEIEVESPLRPKEIQARIRAGETAEEIADAAGIPVERVRWFEGPVLAERAYIAEQAQVGSVRRAGDSSGPGPRLGDIVTVRLSASGTDPADGQWDSRKRGDGNWQVSLTFPSGGRLHVAEWVFDPRRRHVMPDDDNAARLSLPESELPEEPVAIPGEATVTPIASRLGAAAGMGGGFAGGPSVSRFRPERSVIPDRSLGADRSLADRPVVDRPLPSPAPAAERQVLPERAAAPDRPVLAHNPAASPVLPRPAQPDRPGYQGRSSSYDYVEFPESPPYRVPEPAAPAFDDADRTRVTPPRPVVFEDPQPSFADEPPATAAAAAPQTPERAAEPAPPAAAPATASPVSALPVSEPTAPAEPAPRTEAAAPADPAVAAAPVAEESAVTEPAESDAAGQDTDEPPVAAEARASAEPPAVAEPEAAVAELEAAVAEPEAVVAEPEAAVPGTTEPPAAEAPAAEDPAAEDSAGEGASAAEDQSSRARPGAKKNAKGRRSSVPSWDEIMLGSSRQRE